MSNNPIVVPNTVVIRIIDTILVDLGNFSLQVRMIIRLDGDNVPAPVLGPLPAPVLGSLPIAVHSTRMIIRSVLNGGRLPDAIHRTGVGRVPAPVLGPPVLGPLPAPILGSIPVAVHPPGRAPCLKATGSVIAANGSIKTGRLHVMIANENTKKEGGRRTGRRKK